MALIDKAFANIESDESFNDFVEYACGHGNLSRGCLKKGLVGTALDILCDECHNCLHASGFLLWIESLMACRRRALVWFGTKCSSWVSLCVSVSERHASNNYHGNTERSFVTEGNSLMLITSLLFFLSTCIGHLTCLEQPLSSTMVLHPWLRNVLVWSKSQKCVTYMGAYGAKTCKPVQLWSNHCLSMLERAKPQNMGETLATREANGGYTGNGQALQESEKYPELFGLAVADVLVQLRQEQP